MKRSNVKGRLLPSVQRLTGLADPHGPRRLPPQLTPARVTIPAPGPGQRRLSPRQADTLDYIRRYRYSYGFSPAVREIQEYMGINSPNGVMCHLRAMRAKGWITYHPNISRSITPAGERLVSVPLGMVDQVLKFLESLRDD
jgi:hypothetical protein